MLVLSFSMVLQTELSQNTLFYCRQLGHVKAQCSKKKVDYIYNKLMKNYKKQDKKNQKKDKRNKRKEKKESNGK